jgi:hypothetical protein
VLPAFASVVLVAGHNAAQAMEQPATTDVGTIWWAELRTRDPLKTQSFYTNVFGWAAKVVSPTDMERPAGEGELGYTIFSTKDGQEVAGAEPVSPERPEDAKLGWLTYVQVTDVDDAVRKAVESGGRVVNLPSDIPAVGRVAEIEDPEGNRVGIVSPGKA